MATVNYTYDFEKFHLFLIKDQKTLKDATVKCISMASSRAGAHNRGEINTMLVMNIGEEQQLHAYVLQKKLWGDNREVPVFGYVVKGKAADKSAVAHRGGNIIVNIKKEGGQNPAYTFSHCGSLSEDATFVGTTKYKQWETQWGGTKLEPTKL